MIRRKVSTGILRATKAAPTSNAAQAVSGSPMQQQSANLASAVLLNSQRNWKGETVVALKGELKKRGLSQTGNKTTLVARLTSAETSQHLPPMPSFRQISTTSPNKAKKSTPAKEEDTATIKNDKELSTGPEISSKTEEAEAFEEPTKEELNAAPGLPESGKVAPSSGERLGVKMPTQEAEDAADQIIPLEPDNFKATVKEQIDQEEGKENDVPAKIMTVASASTHLSGGPVSAVHNSTDSAEADNKESKSGSDSKSESKSDSKSASKSKSSDAKSKSKSDSDAEASAGESLAHAVNHLTNLSKNAGEFTRSFIPEIGLPKPPKGKGGEYKPPSKGLDDQEKKGLWVLGGIVGLGLLLGGPKKEKKNHGEGGKLGHLVEKVKGEKGVQGDDEWAKASGAGVVGHGARKD